MRTWVMPAVVLAVALLVALALLVQAPGRPSPTWDPGPYPGRDVPAWNLPVFAPAIGALQQWGREQQDTQETRLQELEFDLEWLGLR